MSETTQRPATAAPETVTDSLGRKLTIRKLDALAELDLIEAAGTNAENRRWMVMATLAACVTEINGVPRLFPTKRQDVRGQVKEVGSEGIDAVMKALAPEVAEEPANADEEAAAAKNSPGTP